MLAGSLIAFDASAKTMHISNNSDKDVQIQLYSHNSEKYYPITEIAPLAIKSVEISDADLEKKVTVTGFWRKKTTTPAKFSFLIFTKNKDGVFKVQEYATTGEVQENDLIDIHEKDGSLFIGIGNTKFPSQSISDVPGFKKTGGTFKK